MMKFCPFIFLCLTLLFSQEPEVIDVVEAPPETATPAIEITAASRRSLRRSKFSSVKR